MAAVTALFVAEMTLSAFELVHAREGQQVAAQIDDRNAHRRADPLARNRCVEHGASPRM